MPRRASRDRSSNDAPSHNGSRLSPRCELVLVVRRFLNSFVLPAHFRTTLSSFPFQHSPVHYPSQIRRITAERDILINIAIVEDHPIERYAIRSLFSRDQDIFVAGEGENGNDAIELARDLSLDVMILDIAMPSLSGLDSMVRIRARRPDFNVLILSGFPEETYALEMIERGAAGYLNKLGDPGDIVDAVRLVASGRRFLTPAVSQLLSSRLFMNGRQPGPHSTLSKREFQVFLQLVSGASLKSIGESLSITPKTVAAHRAKVLSKMEMKTRANLTRYALNHGLIK